MNDKTFEKINEEDEEIRKAFESKPMISYRKSRKLKIYLVQTESYPISRTVGCYKSGSKQCEVCKHIIETVTFTSTVTRETFKINHHFDCNDEYLVYLMTCNKCKKQYTSQTTDPCHSRWNNCKSKGRSFLIKKNSVSKKICTNKFESECHSHFHDDVSVVLIDKTDDSNPTKKEIYWMGTLKNYSNLCS